MGDVASSIGGLLGGGGDAGAAVDPGSLFGGGLLGNLFGGTGGSPNVAIPSAPPITTPVATPAIPDVSAATPASTSTAASAANPIPNATGTIDPVTAGTATPDFTSLGKVDPGTVGTIAPPPNIGPITQPSGILGQIFGGNGQGGQSQALKDILGAGVLGVDIARGSQTPPEVKQLQSMAGTDAATAKSFLAQAQGEGQGVLPAGAQALVQNNLDAQIAAIKNRYSQLHMSGSTAETQDINAAKSAALAQTFEIGNTLAQQGLNESNAASGQQDALLQAILAAETAQGTQLGDALAGFAGAAAK
jgi:hypothetical protein